MVLSEILYTVSCWDAADPHDCGWAHGWERLGAGCWVPLAGCGARKHSVYIAVCGAKAARVGRASTKRIGGEIQRGNT